MHRLALVATLALVSLPSHAAADPAASGRVWTVAGNGAPGVDDGGASQATFLAPAGLTASADGTLYVADSSAQRIRAVGSDGRVSTLAGGGALDASGLYVAGGYRDGPAAGARFDRPAGVAVGPNGAVYVADELNHCVRRIANGVVSTYAGAPDRPGKADGPLATAHFLYPRALSFDRDGVLFVADFGVGIRRIGRDGAVSTLPLPGIAPTFTGVSAFGEGRSTVVFAANMQGLAVYKLAGARYYDGSESGPFGHPFAVQAISADEAVFTDVRSQTVRYFRAPREPMMTSTFAKVVAGRDGEHEDDDAGYRDGDATASLFDVPAGVARRADGTVVVADAANRRVRALTLPQVRWPVTDLRGYDASTKDYRIAFVANSFASWDAFWTDSIGGTLERRLSDDRASLGLPKRPHVDVVRIDGSSVAATRDYVEQVLSLGVADLVVFDLNLGHVFVDIDKDRALESNQAWIPAIAADLKRMRAALRAAGSDLVVVVQPTAAESSPLESLATRERENAQNLTYDQFADLDRYLEEAVRRSGVPSIDLVPVFLAGERTTDAVPLFEANGVHPTRAGRELIARGIADALERARPWSAAASPSPPPRAPAAR